jgi:ATP-dependent RNA helicase DeaD
MEPAGPAESAVDQDERDAGTAGQERAPGADATSTSTPAAPAAPTTPPGGTPAVSGGETAGGTRSQHVVHTLPHDWGTIPQFLSSALERLDPEATGTQLLIVTPDAETALAVAEAALALRDAGARAVARGADASPVLAVTRVERAVRQLRARPAPAIAADPGALGALVRASALKLDTVRALILAWADDILDSPSAEELDAVLTEVPKEATRTLVAAEMTEDVEALIERALRRPRRIAPPAGGASALPLSYVATAPSARPAALRRVLDELDPASATVIVASDASEAEAQRAVRALGYGAGAEDREPASPEEAAQRELAAGAADTAAGPLVRVARAGTALPTQQSVVVLYDLPTSREVVERAAASRPAQLVALVQPRQLGALRLLAGGPVRPLVLRDLGRRDAARDAALRLELRAEVSRGLPPRELRVLEDLLEEFDGMELAAAALRLLERERARRAMVGAGTAPAASAGAAAAAPAGGGSGMTRLFVSVGSRDGARAGDLVGAITAEAGITSDKIGKIEVRESFSLVEVANADAERVVAKVNGIAIRGRRVNVRPEREGGRPERGGERPERGGERGGGERRPPGGPGGAGGGKRTFAPRPGGGGAERRPGGDAREPRTGGRTFDARSDGPRGFGGTDDRPVRERAEQRGEWAERAERLQRAKRRAPGAPDAGPADTEG